MKNWLLSEVWGEERVEYQGHQEIQLKLSDNMRDVLERRMILIEDLRKVIQWAEKTGNRLVHTKNGNYLAHHCLSTVTYWVEYRSEGDGEFSIHNAYSHRMQIVEDIER